MNNNNNGEHDDEFKYLPEYYIKTKQSISEFVLQLIFLILVINLESNYYNHNKKSALGHKLREMLVDRKFKSPVTGNLITYKEIMTQVELYSYLNNVFVNLVGSKKEANYSKVIVNFQNYLIGVPRIHIKQVNGTSCQSDFFSKKSIKNQNLSESTFECFTDWSDEKDKKINRVYNTKYLENLSFLDKNIEKKIHNSFRYRNKKMFSNWCVIIGQLNRYDCGGYYIELFRNKEDNIELVQHLQELNWIDLSTRMITIQLNLYNPSIKYTSVIKLIIEFKNSGGAVVSNRLNILFLPLEPKVCCSYKDFKMFFISLFIFCFALMNTYQAWKNFTFYGLYYFKNLWNIFDLFSVIILYIYLYSRLLLTFHESEKILDVNSVQNYMDLVYVSTIFEIKYYSSSLIIFLATIRFIKFITFNKTLTYLVITFKKCAFDLIGLSVTTIIVLAACSIILNLQYGTKHFDYTTITGSLASLFRMFWGDFKYTELHNQEPLFTILLHLFYIYFVYFFLINMILVIIIDTYAYVKSHETNQSSKLHLLEFLRVFIMINLKKCFITEWILSNIFEKLSIKLYCVEDVERELRKRGFNEKEIECMYNKYGLEISNQIDEYLVKDIILWMMESTGKLYDHKFINEKKIKHLKKFCPDRLFLVLNYDLQKINNFLALFYEKIAFVCSSLDEIIRSGDNKRKK
jgi:hypothetical protein